MLALYFTQEYAASVLDFPLGKKENPCRVVLSLLSFSFAPKYLYFQCKVIILAFRMRKPLSMGFLLTFSGQSLMEF